MANIRPPTSKLAAFQQNKLKWRRQVIASHLFMAILDLLGTALLSVCALVVGPILILRGPLALGRIWQYLWVLLPRGLCTGALRGFIDWRLGNFDSALAQMEGTVGLILSSRAHSQLTPIEKQVLDDIFVLMVRAQLHSGHIDEAMQIVQRACKALGVDRLSRLADIDSKTAHLVRAGLAAGKLLDGEGVATLFVKASAPEQHTSPGLLQGPALTSPTLKRNNSGKDAPQFSSSSTELDSAKAEKGKILPFPVKNFEV